MRHRSTELTLLVAALLIAGCRSDTFRVRVLTPDHRPVAGALVSGGIDWDRFDVYTDAAGYAQVPGKAHGWDATIAKDNYFTEAVVVTPGAQFTFRPTPESLALVAELPGTAVVFGPETLITLGYQGQYRVHTYGDAGVTLLDSVLLPMPSKHILLRGDTLWYATHDSGLYAYSLADLRNPVRLLHVETPGYTGPFLVVDSFVVMGDRWENGPLVVYRFRPDGSVETVASVGNQYVFDIELVSHYAVALGTYRELPVVFDISDITNPREVYRGSWAGLNDGLFYGNHVVLTTGHPWSAPESTYNSYGLLDLSDPASPRDLGRLYSDAWLQGIVDDSTAVGMYFRSGWSVLKGGLSEGYTTVALVNVGSSPDLGHGGAFPPYYLIGERLWKLVRRY